LLTYKLLLPSEFSALEKFNAEYSLPPPIVGESLVAVIQNGPDILARWDLHRQLHLDNGTIAKHWRGKFLNLRRLYNLLERDFAPGTKIYSTASSENGAAILGHIGFTEYPFALYTKDTK
jgi:hypothetical protein